jgi:hypothetical protein
MDMKGTIIFNGNTPLYEIIPLDEKRNQVRYNFIQVENNLVYDYVNVSNSIKINDLPIPDRWKTILEDWHEPTYTLRIRAPKSLALEYPQMYVWFQINDLPIHKVGDEALLYCNEVLPEHQPLVDALDSVTVENRPNPADYA